MNARALLHLLCLIIATLLCSCGATADYRVVSEDSKGFTVQGKWKRSFNPRPNVVASSRIAMNRFAMFAQEEADRRGKSLRAVSIHQAEASYTLGPGICRINMTGRAEYGTGWSRTVEDRAFLAEKAAEEQELKDGTWRAWTAAGAGMAEGTARVQAQQDAYRMQSLKNAVSNQAWQIQQGYAKPQSLNGTLMLY